MTGKKKKPAKQRPAASLQPAEEQPGQQMADDGSSGGSGSMMGFAGTSAQTEPPPTEG
jgi:hypothetical protein